MALPTVLSTFSWPVYGQGYLGPFISSAGNVYVLGGDTGNFNEPALWKATDPTTSFTRGTVWTDPGGNSSLFAHQVGDVIHVFTQGQPSGTPSILYRAYNMATDTWGTSRSQSIVTVPVVHSCAGAARSTGSDVIIFYNAPGVVNMGKTYGRVAARRIAGGTTFGAETAIGIALLATTNNTESVEAAVLGTSDRVHLFWNQSTTSHVLNQRTVKSSDNLDGTSPATAQQNVTSTMSLTFTLATADQPVRIASPAFMSSAGEISITSPGYWTGSGLTLNANLYRTYGTSADTISWASAEKITADANPFVKHGAFGSSLFYDIYRMGGTVYDGTDRYTVWVDMANSDVYYDVNTGSGWGTDTQLVAGTMAFVSINIFQRGSNIVLAMVYDQSGTWYYDEVVIRTAAVEDSIPRRNPYVQLLAH